MDERTDPTILEMAAEAGVAPGRVREFLDYVAATHGTETHPTVDSVHAAVSAAQAQDIKLTQVVMDVALHDPSSTTYGSPYRAAQVRPFLAYLGGGYDAATEATR